MNRANPSNLIWVGLLCSLIGIWWIKRAIEGDRLVPGTLFTYIPRWLMITGGILMQTPLPLAWWYLKWTGWY